jgi:hypothetical protein
MPGNPAFGTAILLKKPHDNQIVAIQFLKIHVLFF